MRTRGCASTERNGIVQALSPVSLPLCVSCQCRWDSVQCPYHSRFDQCSTVSASWRWMLSDLRYLHIRSAIQFNDWRTVACDMNSDLMTLERTY